MSLRVCLFERSPGALAPLCEMRPTWDVRAGRFTLAERAREVSGSDPAFFAGRESLAAWWRECHPGAAMPAEIPTRGTLFIDGGLVLSTPLWRTLVAEPGAFRLLVDGALVAARLDEDAHVPGGLELAEALTDRAARARVVDVASLSDAGAMHASSEFESAALVIRTPADLIRRLDPLIASDALLGTLGPLGPDDAPGAHVLGDHPVRVGAGVRIDPGSMLDAREGPITLADDVIVTGHAWVTGPVSIGRGTTLLGGAIGPLVGTGPSCKLRGELAESIVQGYTNKAHDGFIGHSVLGEWVNLGAMTTCSDLKNNYGEIRLEFDGRRVPTGLTKMGTFIGDHAKTAIGTLIATGTVVGPGANVFGDAGLTPKSISRFSWGTHGVAGSYEWARAVATARVAMSRRGVVMTPAYEALLRTAYEGS